VAAEVGSAPDRDVSDRRFAAQLLAGQPATGPLEVVERLLAVQGQDPRGARLPRTRLRPRPATSGVT
jgi:hypothetical protein